MTTIYRSRVLPEYGTVLRRVGDQVTSDVVIAEADVPMGYRLIDLERELGIAVPDARKVLVKGREAEVEEGEVIAKGKGLLFKPQYVSPVNGRLIDAREGKVLIEVAPRHVELTAFYPGQIVNVIPDRGVMIQFSGALVQGVWGAGQEVSARLELAVPDGESTLEPDAIVTSHMGAILVGGRSLDEQALARAIEGKVQGIIVGSISSALMPLVASAPLSLMLTEGFGDMPMNADTFALLQLYAGREALLNPVTGPSHTNCFPELLVPLPAQPGTPAEHKHLSLRVGTRVRVLCLPYWNMIGRVAALPPHLRRVESGVKAHGAEVDLESVGRVFVPLENLEIVR